MTIRTPESAKRPDRVSVADVFSLNLISCEPTPRYPRTSIRWGVSFCYQNQQKSDCYCQPVGSQLSRMSRADLLLSSGPAAEECDASWIIWLSCPERWKPQKAKSNISQP